MANDDRNKKIADLTDRLTQVTTHPQFIGMLNQLEQLPDEEKRKEFVRREMNVAALVKKGVPIPDGFRSVVRVFENPAAGAIPPIDGSPATATSTSRALQEAEAITVCGSVGFIVCASVGGEI